MLQFFLLSIASNLVIKAVAVASYGGPTPIVNTQRPTQTP